MVQDTGLPAPNSETDNKRETAQYITDMLLELRNLALGAELKALSDALEPAYYEAFAATNKVEVPPAEAKRIRAMEQAAKDVA